jgi:hypothetical protein
MGWHKRRGIKQLLGSVWSFMHSDREDKPHGVLVFFLSESEWVNEQALRTFSGAFSNQPVASRGRPSEFLRLSGLTQPLASAMRMQCGDCCERQQHDEAMKTVIGKSHCSDICNARAPTSNCCTRKSAC